MVTKELIETKLRENIPLTKAWSNIRRSAPELLITSNAEQIIMGSLLGDGSIIRKRTNCLLTFNHSLVQRDYVFYKVNLLQREGIHMRYEELIKSYGQGCIEGRLIKDNGQSRGTSEVNVAFNRFRDEWYTPTKEVPDCK